VFPYSSLKLTSTPPGAGIWEGRQRLGATPMEWQDLRASTRIFGLLLPGYRFMRVRLEIPEGQAVVREIALEKSRDFVTSFGMPMVWIDGGGAGGYWTGRYEVRQSDWEAILPGRNASAFRGASRPVENVSWQEAMEFCQRLTERERAAGKLPAGHAYLLPTEIQWDELASDATPATAVVSYSQTLTGTADVGTSEPNAYGIFDAVGNVWEWCRDNYDGTGRNKSIRGGCWLSSQSNFPSKATRSGAAPAYRDRFIGLRVVLAPVK
jgi:formylglycine-generating enzyme required for sulfatase activity